MDTTAENIEQTNQQQINNLQDDQLSCSSYTSQDAMSNNDLTNLNEGTKRQARLVIPGFEILLEKKQKKGDMMKIIRRMSSVMAFFSASGSDNSPIKKKQKSSVSLLGQGISTNQWMNCQRQLSIKNIARLASTKEIAKHNQFKFSPQKKPS